MEYNPYERVAPDAPNRCQGATMNGQCQLVQAPESKYCIMHGGAGVAARNESRNYKNTQVKSRINEYMSSPDAMHSLAEEIALLRLSLDTILGKLFRAGTTDAEAEIELHARLPMMVDLIDKIGKLVPVSQKLDTHYSKTVGKSELLAFAGDVVKILSDFIDDPQTLRDISDAILAKLG